MSPTEEALQALHKETIALLLKRVKSGEATAADLNVARGILNDNKIQCLPEANPDMMALKDSLPFKPEVKFG
jgi:hypothetical protein